MGCNYSLCPIDAWIVLLPKYVKEKLIVQEDILKVYYFSAVCLEWFTMYHFQCSPLVKKNKKVKPAVAKLHKDSDYVGESP